MMEEKARYSGFLVPRASRTTRVEADTMNDQDGLSIICIILRHIDSENLDYDTVLYCYLKVRLKLEPPPKPKIYRCILTSTVAC